MAADSKPALHEIAPPAGPPARYTQRPFPPYRYVPGLQPHPIIHPEGHSYNAAGKHPAAGPLLLPERWHESHDFLYGTDLYNHGYWWEAHEAWEGLWQQTDKSGMQGRLLQGLIQISAAHLKLHVGQRDGVDRLLLRAMEHLGFVAEYLGNHEPFMGVGVHEMMVDVRGYFQDQKAPFPFLVLQE